MSDNGLETEYHRHAFDWGSGHNRFQFCELCRCIPTTLIAKTMPVDEWEAYEDCSPDNPDDWLLESDEPYAPCPEE